MERVLEIRAVVDQSLCGTTGQCMLTLPEVFRQREPDGIAEVCLSPVPQALHAAVRLAASQCPVAAIRIVECEAPAGDPRQAGIGSAPPLQHGTAGPRHPGGSDGTF